MHKVITKIMGHYLTKKLLWYRPCRQDYRKVQSTASCATLEVGFFQQ